MEEVFRDSPSYLYWCIFKVRLNIRIITRWLCLMSENSNLTEATILHPPWLLNTINHLEKINHCNFNGKTGHILIKLFKKYESINQHQSFASQGRDWVVAEADIPVAHRRSPASYKSVCGTTNLPLQYQTIKLLTAGSVFTLSGWFPQEDERLNTVI